MTIKIAVLGAGRWGVHLVRNLLENPQASLVAVVDPNWERLEALRSRHQFDDSVVLATDWEKVRSLPGLEAVAIVTPASTHYNLVADALKQGYHVLAEKPLTLQTDECVELSRLAEQQQRQLVIDHTYLFHPVVEAGKTVIQNATLGDLRYGYATRTNLGPVRQDVDAMWDLAIHDIAIFNNWLSETPIQVQANGTVWLQSDLADLVWVTLTYPSGFQAFIHLSWLNPDKQRRLCVAGSQGTLIFDELSSDAPLTIQYGSFKKEGNRFNPVNVTSEAVSVEKGEPLKRVCEHFLGCVIENKPSTISSGWVGADLVKILRALSESLQQGGVPIKVL